MKMLTHTGEATTSREAADQTVKGFLAVQSYQANFRVERENVKVLTSEKWKYCEAVP